MTNSSTEALSSLGVSIWLDDLSRSRIESGDLARLLLERSVTGVTTNPSI
ncbi:transaldolase, partial [Leucobacter sp. M11]|nr:transaldolase [Leucobacter sp. M11]